MERNEKYKKTVIASNIGLTVLLFIASIFGSGRESTAGLFIIGYPLLIITNIALAIRNVFKKNKERYRLHFFASGILTILAIPLFMFVIIAVGGIC